MREASEEIRQRDEALGQQKQEIGVSRALGVLRVHGNEVAALASWLRSEVTAAHVSRDQQAHEAQAQQVSEQSRTSTRKRME